MSHQKLPRHFYELVKDFLSTFMCVSDHRRHLDELSGGTQDQVEQPAWTKRLPIALCKSTHQQKTARVETLPGRRVIARMLTGWVPLPFFFFF